MLKIPVLTAGLLLPVLTELTEYIVVVISHQDEHQFHVGLKV